jgi:hypothetical protein
MNDRMMFFCLAQNLIGEMKRMNMNLPARVWIPFYKFPHHVVRIAYTESTVLNSRDRVCTFLQSLSFVFNEFLSNRLLTLSTSK